MLETAMTFHILADKGFDFHMSWKYAETALRNYIYINLSERKYSTKNSRLAIQEITKFTLHLIHSSQFLKK